jgi:hypothetical protein
MPNLRTWIRNLAMRIGKLGTYIGNLLLHMQDLRMPILHLITTTGNLAACTDKDLTHRLVDNMTNLLTDIPHLRTRIVRPATCIVRLTTCIANLPAPIGNLETPIGNLRICIAHLTTYHIAHLATRIANLAKSIAYLATCMERLVGRTGNLAIHHKKHLKENLAEYKK